MAAQPLFSVDHDRIQPATDTTTPINAQHAQGKLTAGERIELLLDAGSCTELGMRDQHSGSQGDDGVITVHGTINGRPVCVFAKDISVGEGTLGTRHGAKICRLQELALESRIPIIGLFDSAGMRLEAGMDGLSAYGAIAKNCALSSGLIPQIALVCGPCRGADALLPPLFDLVFMTKTHSSLFVTAPDIVAAVTGEQVDADKLGGWDAHTKKSSIAHGAFDNDVLAIRQIRRLVGLLPSTYGSSAPARVCHDQPEREAPALDTLLPQDGSGAYDIKEALLQISDDREFFELQAEFAQNLVIGLAGMGGKTVGMVANQPRTLAGVLDRDATRKAARFVRFCNTFDLPVVSFVDAPGFLPGVAEEQGGLATYVADLLRAYAQASVPLVTVVVRKAYGAAGVAMGSRAIGADLVYSWPDTQIGMMGAKGATALIPEGQPRPDPAAYVKETLAPEAVAASGGIDDIIAPRQTRRHIIRALGLLAHKCTQHRHHRSAL
jgi:propionyl-CoA carboxylase beta chain